MIAAQHWEFKSPAETLTLFPNNTTGSHFNKPITGITCEKYTGRTKFKAKRNLESCPKSRTKQKATYNDYAFVLNEAVVTFIFLGIKGQELNSCLHSNSNSESVL